MIGDTSLPAIGGIGIPIVAYALLSGFVTGPLVAERTIENSGWHAQCRQTLATEAEISRPASPAMPKLNCNSLMGLFGDDGNAICRDYGNWSLPFADQIIAERNRIEELQSKRFAIAAAQSGTRCDCAAAVMTEEHRLVWGLHAGSIRIVTPPSVRNLQSGLVSALHSPWCAGGAS
ncbi:MAG: hypothetical protein KDJ90_24365 [Nitratireductor sp.]|nr:hypothetical protein [Nitratireductor sp.]